MNENKENEVQVQKELNEEAKKQPLDDKALSFEKAKRQLRIAEILATIVGIGIVVLEISHCRELAAARKENQLLGEQVKKLGNQLNEAWYQVGKASQIGKKL